MNILHTIIKNSIIQQKKNEINSYLITGIK